MLDDCWVIVGDKVLNVTSFLEDHPGGESMFYTLKYEYPYTMNITCMCPCSIFLMMCDLCIIIGAIMGMAGKDATEEFEMLHDEGLYLTYPYTLLFKCSATSLSLTLSYCFSKCYVLLQLLFIISCFLDLNCIYSRYNREHRKRNG